MTSAMDKKAYNKYYAYPTFAYKCISHLIDNNELVWKLLKYSSPDAWEQPNLSEDEKRALIWNGLGDSTDFNVFMDDGLPDVETREDCILRIAPYGLSPDVKGGRTVGTLTMLFETYCHYKSNTLTSYQTRVDTIMQQMLEVFNGEPIDGIGRLHFSKLGTSATRMEIGGQIPFKGKWILMGSKLA